jgi:hypothetical protein
MLLETIVWLIISILMALLSDIGQKYFTTKNIVLKEQVQELEDIKAVKYKTLDDQMKYVRGRSDMGKDFVTTIASAMVFLLGFYMLIYPRIPNLYIGLGIVFVLSIIFAWINTKLTKSEKFFDYHFITSFISYIYTGTFLIYVKFIETIHPIILLICGIIVMILYGYANKWRNKNGRNNKSG